MKKIPLNPELDQEIDQNKKPTLTGLGKAAVVGAISVGLGFAAGSTDTGKEFVQHSIEHVVSSPDFSPETKDYVLGKGEGLTHAVRQIDGIENIRTDVAIDYVERINGIDPGQILQQGQSIKIPVSVSNS